MRFGKNIMRKLGLVLAMAVPALAAEAYPLYYEGNTTQQNNQYWDSLMTFKFWGTHGFSMYRGEAPDTLGNIGSADGDIIFQADRNDVGGKILSGKNFEITQGESKLSGPVRTVGNFISGSNGTPVYKGYYCIGGTASGDGVNKGIVNAHSGDPASLETYLRTGPDALLGECAAEKISPIPTYLSVPEIYDADASYNGALDVSGSSSNPVVYFDVPPIGEDKKQLWDLYYESICIHNGGELRIRMPYEGGNRLVRIFLSQDITFNAGAKLRVEYVNKDAVYDYINRKWTNVTSESKILDNEEYIGNLLIYMKNGVEWTTFQGGDRLQGSFISQGKIKVGSNLHLAGQLIASELEIVAEFDGKAFRYVPFDPPILRLKPTAGDESVHMVEGHDKDYVKITLDKSATTSITFRYCFEFEGEELKMKADGNFDASAADFAETLPLYNPSTGTCGADARTAGFSVGSTELESPIELKVKNDPYIENVEKFKIWIVDLAGAKLESGSQKGAIELFIDDNDGKPFGEDITVAGTEDIPYMFDAFNVTNSDGDALEKYSVEIASFPSKGTLSYVKAEGDTVAVAEKQKISSDDIVAGKFVYRFVKDDYTVDTQADYHRYDFEFRVIDALGNSSDAAYKATVTVAPVNDAPVASDAEFTIAEKSVTTSMLTAYADGDIGATDVDGDALTYSFDLTADARTAAYYENVAKLYDIEPMTGKIFVKPGADLDYESPDSLLYIKVKVTDDGHTTADPDDALDVTVLVTLRLIDVNEVPTITGVEEMNKDYEGISAEFTLYPKENLEKGDSVGVVKATDPDTKHLEEFGHLEYSIVESDVPFVMSHDTIRVNDPEKLNFEGDEEVKFTFNVKVTNCEWDAANNKATDRCLETTQLVTVVVQDEPEKPEILCKDNTDPLCKGPYHVAENTDTETSIYKFLVTDPDKGQAGTVIPEIVADEENAFAKTLFGVKMEQDATTKDWMLVLFVADESRLNYEEIKPSYDVTLKVTDANGLTATIDRTIIIDDVNEKPVLAGKDTTITIKENLGNGATVGTIPALDPDIINVAAFAHLEYEILPIPGEKDSPFKMESNNIVVQDVGALNYEALKPDTSFTFNVRVVNCPIDTATGTYPRTEKCLYDVSTVTVAVTDEAEKTEIIPDCEGPNCEECLGDGCKDTMDSLCVENCDEPHGNNPTKALTLKVEENSPTGYVVANYLVRDEDIGIGHNIDLVASFKNTNSSGADSLFVIEMKKDSYGNWRVVVSVKDGSILDYEKVKELHNLTILVKDPEDPGDMGDSLLRVIRIVDVNEAPVVADTTFRPDENLPNGTPIGTLVATDPDVKNINFSTLTYSIVDADVPFAIDNKGVITVKDSARLNYEKNPSITFKVTVSDGELSDDAVVKVELQDVPEKPKIVVDDPDDGDDEDDSDPKCIAYCKTEDRGHSVDSTLTVGISENSPNGTVVFEYIVSDEDAGDVALLDPSLVQTKSNVTGVTAGDLFEISTKKVGENWKVVVTVKDSAKLDYEELRQAKKNSDPDPQFYVSVVVKDPKGLADTIYRVIDVLDENESPLFDVKPCTIAENNEIGDSLGRIEHPSDIDSLSRTVDFYDNQFKLIGGDTALFDLKYAGPMNIALVAKVKFDCENDKYECGVEDRYHVVVEYFDKKDPSIKMTRDVPITLLDVNERPIVLTDTIGVDENAPKGTVVDTVKWSDDDVFDTTMLFKLEEDPSGCFEIGPSTGVVTVKTDKCAALDYERGTTIPITVSITDSLGEGHTVTKAIKVNIHDVNEAPSIVEKTFLVDEDAKVGSVVDTVKAVDPDKDPKFSKLVFSVVGGDTSVFKIDSITGVVTLKDTLDYEAKDKYELVVRVFDGEFADTAKVPIYVNNKDERTEVKITLFDDSAKVWHDPDTIFTNNSGREICWVQGRSDRDMKDTCASVHITKDTVIVIRYKDPTTDSYGVDSLVIFYSDAAPIVTITGDQDANLANNFYTIVENPDNADTNLYVNDRNKDVRVTVKDPANGTDTSFVVNLKLETVNVPQKSLDALNAIVNENRFVLNENPKGGSTRTPVNGNEVKISYKEVFGKDTVTVSYMTDAKGNPVMVPVVDAKGNVGSVEVMTVSYNTEVNGQTVTISFIVNSVTGEVLVKDSNGTLMESGASRTAYSSSSKAVAASSSSGSGSGTTESVTEGLFLITYSVKDVLGNSTTVSYSVDEKGRMVQNGDGDTGYAVAYTYTNKYGNSATQSLFIVLDQTGPTVEILSPVKGQVIRSNYVEVVWTVNGVVQDTLTVQGLDKGPNYIKRFYRDKAGNEAADTVLVIMKDSKDVDIAVVTPVTEMNPDEVKEYYDENPLEPGETFAVSILNPSSGKEVETLKGGSFDTKPGSGEELYPGKDKKHLGPTLALDVKLPTIKDGEGNTGLGGLATLDDLILPNGKISNIGIGIDTSKLSAELKREYKEYTVEEYVEKFCEEGTRVPSDLSKFNMYNTKMSVNIWIYTSLGNFVDYFSFSQEMNDPEYTNDAGKLKMFFEMKPNEDGFVRADNGKLYATGAYLYKVEASIRSTLRCTILSEEVLHDKPNAKRKGDKIKSSDDLLKPFGYKRPKAK